MRLAAASPARSSRWRSEIINLIVQIVSGAIGGNVAGGFLKNIVLSPLLKTISGAVGGGLGGTILQSLIPALGSAASVFPTYLSPVVAHPLMVPNQVP
jgi:hypothetical protein